MATPLSCEFFNHLSSDKALTKKIEEKFISEKEIIDISQLNSFDWDELLIIGPYSVVEKVEKELNLDLKNIKGNAIEYSDNINLFIFLKGRKPVKISEISRAIGDFSIERIIIKKSKVKFKKTEDKQFELLE